MHTSRDDSSKLCQICQIYLWTIKQKEAKQDAVQAQDGVLFLTFNMRGQTLIRLVPGQFLASVGNMVPIYQ